MGNLTGKEVAQMHKDYVMQSWSKSCVDALPGETAKGIYFWYYDGKNYATTPEGLEDFHRDADEFLRRVGNGDVLNYEMLQLQKEDVAESRTTSLHSTVVVGAEYELLDKWLAIGALSTTRFTKPKTQTEITLSANIRPKSWLNAAISYSMIQSAGKSFGLAVKLGPLFIGTDYMFFGKNTKTVNGFVGISVPLGGKKSNKEG